MWRSRLASFFSRWIRLSAGLYISLAFSLLCLAQEGAPRERIRFLDGKVELCEVVAADADGITLRLSGISQPVRFRWWQLASEDAGRLREARTGRAAVAAEGEFLVPGYRIRTTEDRVYEGVVVEGAPPGQLWLKNSEGTFVIRIDSIASRDPIKVDLARAYAPDEIVGILVGRIKPRSPEDYDLLGLQLLRAKLQARAVSAFKVAEMLRHPESPEARMVGELVRLRDQIDDLAIRRAVFQAEEQALAGDYDAAIAQVEIVEKLLAGHPEAIQELHRVRTELQEFRGLARDDRMIMEGYRAAEALLMAKAMDRTVSFAAARDWAQQKLSSELLEHLRTKFNISPEDATARRVWEGRPTNILMKHSYEGSSWIVTRPDLRSPDEWWAGADDRVRYDLLKGLYIEKNLTVVQTETKSCGVCGGTGQVEQKNGQSAICPSCQGQKGYRVLIYR